MRGCTGPIAFALAAGFLGAQPVVAQEASRAPVPGLIVTLDQEALFARSAFGQRVQRELGRERADLVAENRRIETELIEEEEALTERRSEMSPEEFSALAADFDARVQQIRDEQDSKSRRLQQRLDEERQEFLGRIGPVLAELVRRRGASAIIDRNAMLLVFDEIDITEQAVALADARIGDGSEPADTDAATDPAPAPESEDAP